MSPHGRRKDQTGLDQARRRRNVASGGIFSSRTNPKAVTFRSSISQFVIIFGLGARNPVSVRPTKHPHDIQYCTVNMSMLARSLHAKCGTTVPRSVRATRSRSGTPSIWWVCVPSPWGVLCPRLRVWDRVTKSRDRVGILFIRTKFLTMTSSAGPQVRYAFTFSSSTKFGSAAPSVSPVKSCFLALRGDLSLLRVQCPMARGILGCVVKFLAS